MEKLAKDSLTVNGEVPCLVTFFGACPFTPKSSTVPAAAVLRHSLRSAAALKCVYADTKVPLKEHAKDGEIYVEAEPDVDYFIAVRCIASGSRLIRSRWQAACLSIIHRFEDGESIS